MRVRHPLQRLAQRDGFAGVERDAGASAGGAKRMHVIHASLAADHDRQSRGKRGMVVQRPRHGDTVVAVEQFEIALDRVGRAGGFGGARIGGIGEVELAVATARPQRPRRRGCEGPQHLGFFPQAVVAQRHLGEIAPQSAEVADPHDRLAADGAAHGFHRSPGRCEQVEQKAFACSAQRIDRMIHLQRRFRRQPGSERQNPQRLFCILRQQQRGVAADSGPVLARAPGNQNLRFCEQQRAEAIGFRLKLADFGAQPLLVGGSADARAHQQDGADHRETEHAQRHRQRGQVLPAEIREGVDQPIRQARFRGPCGRDVDKTGRASARDAALHQRSA